MLVHFLKAKIHRATVTDANLHYTGSITIDRRLLEASGIRPFEKVEIYNVTNGERFATYAIEGGPGEICLNGAAAWKAKAKDLVIIASYCMLSDEEQGTHQPALVYVNEKNEIQSVARGNTK
jgi:aspartate 1-decarboxylase